jgi:autotransporter-associated beta strand protein
MKKSPFLRFSSHQHAPRLAGNTLRIMPFWALSALGSVSGLAASITWNGGGTDNNWSSSANWGGTAPANNDALIFGGSTGLTNSNNWLSSVGAVTFSSGGFSITGNALTLNGDFTNDGTNTWGINSTLGAARIFTSNSGTLTLGGSITNAGFLTTISGNGNTIISGVLGGSGGLAKTGTGTLTLTNANTYTGTTSIAPGGTLSISQDTNLGNPPASATAGSLIIDSTGTLATTVSFTLNQNRGIKIGPTSGTGAGTIDVLSGTILTYGGIITSNGASGTGGLTKAGAGTLVLSGANTYTGTTSINVGTLQLGSTTAIPSGSGKGDVVVDATLDLNGKSATVNGLSSVGSSGIITSGAGGAITFTAGGNNGSGTYNGTIQNGSGTIAFVKTGSGTITLGGNNTFTGGVTINGGALQLANAGALNSASPNNLAFGAAAAVGTKLQLNGHSVTVSSLATNSTPGSVILENASVSAATLTVNQSSSTTFAGVIQNGGGGALALTKSGTGTLTLSRTNTYSGNTTITGGVLQAGFSLALPSGAGTGNVVLDGGASAGMLDLNGFDVSINGLAGVTGAVVGKVVNNLSATNKSFTVGNGDASTSFAGQILDHSTGTGTLNLIKTGSGTLTLSSTSSYSGTTTIKNGVVALGVANALPATTALTLGDGTTNASGVLQLNGYAQSLTGLAIAGTGTGNRIVNGSATAVNLTLSVASSSSFSGSFGGPGTNENNLGLIKTGAGVLTLSGSSTYTGTTTISNGTLSVSNLTTGGNLGSAVSAVTLGDATNKGILSYGGNGDTFSRGFTLGAGGGEVDSTVSTKVLAITTNNITGSGLFSIGGAGDTSISSNITSTGGLSKSGLGTLTLSGVNTYSGTTSILNGVIALGVGNTGLNAATTLTLGDASANTNGVLKLNGFSQTLAGLSKVGNGTLNRVVGGSASLSNLTLNSGSVNVVLGGSATNENNLSFTKFGTGTLTLSATNTYTGGTIIGDTTSGNNGILAVSGDANLGTTGGVTIWYSTLQITSSFSFTRSITLSHTSSSILVDASQNFSTSGPITGTGALNLTGPGTLTVSGTSNSWAGGTNVQNGTLALGATNALPTSTIVTLGAGTNSGILKLGGYNQTIGGLTNSGSGGSNKVVNGSLTASTLTIDNSLPYSFSGVLGGAGTNENNFGLTKSNTGLLTLTGVNTYTGVTNISAGTLVLSGGAAIADTGAVSLANIFGATLQLNNNETIGSLAGGGATGGNVNLQSNTLTVGGNNTSTTFSGVISGPSGGLVKTGTGTLTLANSNTFIGGVTINSGTLQLANTGALNSTTPNSVTFGASAPAGTKLQLNGTSVTIGALSTNVTPGTVAIENASASAATLTVSQSTNTTFAGLLQDGSGALSFAKDGTGNLTIHNAVAATYTGTTSILNGVLTLGGGGGNTLPTGTTVTLGTASTTTSGKLVLGDADNDNDDQTLSGLLTAGTGTTNTVAGGNATRTSTLTLNIAGTNLYTGILGGTTATEKNLALVKTGSGTLTLSGTNTYTGTTTITGGTLSVGADANLGTAPGSATAASIILNGATLSSSASFTLASNRGLSIGPASGSGNGTLDVATGTILTYTGVIANNGGTGSLIKIGAGSLTLGGASTYTGDTSIQNGMLILSSGGNRLPITTVLTLGDGASGSGVLKMNGLSQTVAGLFTSGAGTNNRVINDNLISATFTINNATDYSFAGILGATTSNENNFAFTKSGSGVLTLSGSSSYTGGTTLTGGTININNDAALGASSGSLTFNGSGTLTLKLGATIASSSRNIILTTAGTIDSNGYNLSTGGIISSTGSLSKIGAGTLTLSGASLFSGGTNIKNGSIVIAGNDDRLLTTGSVVLGDTATTGKLVLGDGTTARSQTLAGLTITGLGGGVVGSAAANSVLTLNIASSNTFAGTLGGAGSNENNLSLVKSGVGMLVLSGSNTFIGGLTINTGGVVQLGSAGALNSAGTNVVTFGASAAASTKLQLNGNSITVAGLQTNATAGTPTVENANSAVATLTVNNSTGYTYAGVLADGTGGGALSLIKTGAGTMTLSGSSTFTGGTTIKNGAVVIAGGNDRLLTTGSVVLGDTASTGKLILGDGTTVRNQTLAGLTIAGLGGSVVGSTATNSVLTLSIASSNTFAGTLGGAGTNENNLALTKSGAGTLTLSGTNTYTGLTTISAGTLALSNGSALADTDAVSVSSGATLLLNNSETIGSLTGAGAVNLGVNTLTVGGDNTSQLAYSGAIAATAGSLVKIGTGTLTLTGSSTFTGGTTIKYGSVVISGGNDRLLTTGSVVLGDTTTTGKLILGDGTTARNQTLAGLTITGLGGSVVGSTATNSVLTLNIGTGNTNTFAGTLGGAGTNENKLTLTKSGAGTLTLSGTNTFTGGVTINTGGVLQLASAEAINASGLNIVTFGASATAATKLQLNGNSVMIAGLQTNATAGSPIVENGSTSASAILTINNSGPYTYASAINDGSTKTLALIKTGSGTQTLTGTSGYTGGTTISGGILAVSKDAALGNTTGQLSIGAGKLQATATITSSLRNITLTDTASTIIVDSGFTYTEAGVISGSGTLNKEGLGVFQISGTANTYNGGTVVAAGLLDVIATSGTPLGSQNASDTNNNVTVNAGTNLSLSSASNKGSNQTITVKSSDLALGGIGFSNKSLTQANLTGMFTDSTSSYGGVLGINTTYDTAGNELNLSTFGNGKWYLGSAVSGTYALTTLTVATDNIYRLGGGGGTLTLSKSNVLTGTSNEVLVGSGLSNGNGTVVVSLGQSYGDSTTGGKTTVTGGAILSIGIEGALGTAPLTLQSARLVLNGGTLQTGAAMTLNANRGIAVGPGASTLDTNGKNVDYAGIIANNGASTGSFTKIGTGTLTLTGNHNTYTGATNINGGTISFTGINDLGLGSAINFGVGTNGGTLLYAADNIADITARIVTTTGTGGATIDTGSYNVSFSSNAISGTGSFTKAGTGILTLNVANSYQGNTTISLGTIKLGNVAAIPSATTASTTTVTGTLDLNGLSPTVNLLRGAGTITNSGTSDATLSVNTAGSSTAGTFSGAINDGGTNKVSFIKTNANTLNLTGTTSTYSGVTTVSGGTLSVAKLADINTASSIGKGSVSGSAADLILNGGTLQFSGTSVQSTNRLFSIGTTAGSSLDASGTSANTISFTNTGALGFAVDTTTNRTLTLTGTNTGANTFAPVIGNPATSVTTSLTKSGAGTWVLTGANTYSGNTTISAGTLRAGSALAIPAGAGTGNVVLNGGGSGAGTLDLNGNNLTINGLAGTSNTVLGAVVNNLTATSKSFTVGSGDASSTFAGQILDHTSGTGTISLVKTGIGTLTLSGGTSTYTGGTTISGGTININNDAALGASAGALTFNGTNITLQLGATITSSSRNITLSSDAIIDTNSYNLTTSGAFSGAYIVNKIGTGTLTLTGSGSSSSQTATYIKNGSLAVSGGNDRIPTASTVQLGDTSTTGKLVIGSSAAAVSQTLAGLSTTGLGGSVVGAYASGNSTLNVNLSGNNSFSGTLGGAGTNENNLTLTKSGSAMLTLSGTNTFTGGVIINAGILQLGSAGAINSGTPNSITFGPSAPSGTKLQLNGNSITIGALAADSSSGTAVVENANASASTMTVNQSSSTTFAGTLRDGTGGGALTLTKTGTGALSLAGTSSHTGGTNIQNGSLVISGGDDRLLTSGSVVLGGSGTSGKLVLGEGTARNQTLAGLTTSGSGGSVVGSASANSTLTLNIAVSNTFAGTLGGAGTNENNLSLNKTGAGSLVLSGASAYTGGTTISGGTLSISADTNLGGSAGTLSIGAGTLQVSANIASSTRAITLTDATAAISVANNISFTTSGAISGTGMPLNLTGQGTLVVLGTSNSYSGGTNVQNGTLAIGANNALPIATTVTLGAGSNNGTLKLNGQNQEIAGLAVSGTGTSNKVVGGSATSSTLTLNLPGTAFFGGVLGGVGTNENNFGLTKTSAGTLTLTGTNTYTGATTISAGTLALSGGTAIADTSAVSLNDTPGAILLLNTSETIGSLAGGGTTGGNVNLQANTLSVGGDNTSTTYYGVISGSGSLTKIGSGTLQLHTATGETYGGATAIQNGTVQIGGGGGGTLPSGSVLTLGTASSATAGKLILGDGDNDNDDQTLAGLLVASGNTGTNYVVGGNTNRTSALTLNIATSNTYAGVLGGTTTTEKNLSLAKTGAGTLTLTGTNTYTGGTTITNGTLSIGADANIGSSPGSATPNNIVINGGTLSTSATFTLTANRGISVGPSSGTGSGTLDVTAGTTLTYGGVIANNGSGTGGLTKTNTTGTLVLSGSNTYSGDTTVQGGTLQLGIATAIPSGTGKGNVSLATGSTLDVNNYSATINGLSGTGTVSNGLAGSCTFSAGAGDATSSFGGIIQDGNGTLSFTKVGNGTLTLTAVQTYSGTTTLSVGTLKLGIANALPSGFGKGNITVNGTLDLAGYAQTINALTGTGYVTNSIAGTAILSVGSQNTSSTFSGNIQDGTGKVALTKIGTGVLTLAGTNTYAGATTISTGTLQVGSLGGLSPNSTITIAAVGTLDVNGFNATMDGLLGTGTITNNGASAVTLTAGSAGGTSSFDGVIQDGTHALALTKGGAGTLTLTGVNTYSGATTISNGTISVANPGVGGNLGTSTGAITLGDATHQGTLSYTGSSDLSYTRGFVVNAGGGEIDGTAAGKTITLQTGGIATSGTFALGGAGNAIIQSVISGTGGLTKGNSGTMLLAGANTYAGNTTVSSGTLLVGAAVDGSDNAPIPFGAGKGNVVMNGTLDVNNFNVTLNGLSGAGVITNSASGTSRTLTVGAADGSGSFSGSIQNGAGSLALTKIGGGTITLANANSYSGDTTISAGTLQVGNAAAIPSGPNTGNVSLAGTLDLHSTSINVNGLSGSGTVTNSGGSAAVIAVGANDQTCAFGGNIIDGSSATGLTKTGTGILTLSGNNTFSGATTISQGTVSMGTATGLSSHSVLTIENAGTLDINGKSIVIDGLDGTGVVNNNNAAGPVTLTTGASGGSGLFGGALNDGSGVIALVKAGGGTQTLTVVNGYSGGTTVTGGLLAITSYGALGAIPATPTVANIVLNGGGISASNTFEINSHRGIAVGPSSGTGVGMLDAALNQTLTYNGIIANNGAGSGGLAKTGLGTVTLGGVNTYTGDTTISVGALQIGNALAIPSGSGKGNVVVNATLDLNNTSITVNGLSGSGLVSNTKAGAATLSAGANDQTSTFDGVIANGNGITALTKVGSGTLTLTGTNSHSGGSTVAAGTLSVSADANLGAVPNTTTPGNIAINAGATLAATSTFTLNANRGIAVGPSGAGTINVASNQTLTYGGAIANNGGSGGFTKSGTGTLVLSGTSSYTGTTTVTAGVLTVNGSTAGSGSTVVLPGATLTGTGTTGAMTVDPSGTLSPGNFGIGTLGASGGLTLTGNADFQLGTPGANHAAPGLSDLVNVTGDIYLGGNLNLTDNAGANGQGSVGAGSYKIFTYTGATHDSFGSVSGLPSYHWALHDVPADKAIYIDMYNYAVATITPEVDLGRIHAGGSFGTQALKVGNTTASGDYTESLGGVIGSTATGITATGSVTGIAGQASNSSNLVVGISDNSAGQKNGLVGVDFTSQAVSGSGLNNTALARQNVAVTGFAYSGQSVWNISGSGSWGNNANDYGNWTHAGGVAGLDGVLSANDTATFGNAITSPTTVSLDGANPTVRAITFDHTVAYTLAQGSGGQLTLKGNGSPATITDASGSHSISAPLSLASNANVAVTHPADTLTISGAISGTISGNGITKIGDGTLVLTGHSNYTGATLVSAGTLLVNGSLGNSTTTIDSGATLAGTGTLGGSVAVNGTLAPGEINSIGTIGVDSLYLSHTMAIEWNGSTDAIDQVNVTHSLELGQNSTIVFTGMEGTLTQSAYVFATYETLTGPFRRFNTVTDIPDGYLIDYNYGAQSNQLALVAIPEPRAALLGGIGLLLLLKRRRETTPGTKRS